MLPRLYLVLNALGLCGAVSSLEDTVAMVQTKTVSRQDPAPIGSTCTFDGCGPPWEAQVVTVLSKATATTSPCYECAETGFQLYMRNKVPKFLFQPWRRTITVFKDTSATPSVYYMPWTPTEGVFHNQTVVMRNNGVHTYIFTDGGDPNYVFRVDFFHEHTFARNDREYGMFHIYTPLQARPSGSSERRIGEILNGQTQCYGTTATEDHCLSVPAGSQRYTRYPMSEPYLMDSSNTPKICRAWGDPHYTTFAGQKYDFMGTGTFTVSKIEGGANEHTLQVFNCPVKSGSTWNRRISQGIALAVRLAGRTVSFYKGVTKVDGGAALPYRLHYFQGLILDVKRDSLVIQAFGVDAFVMIRVTTRYVTKSAFGYVYDVTVQVPWKAQDSAVGLCKEKGDYFVPSPEILFDALTIKELEDTCCPPEGCTTPDPNLPPPNWTDLCTECNITQQAATAACAAVRVDDRDACLMDYCASCGDPDSVPPPPEDYPRDPIPPGPPFAVEDPHCRNVKGEAFDLHATGQLTFLRLPLQGPEQLRLDAFIEPVDSRKCAPTVIKKVVFSGAWLNDMPPLVVSPRADGGVWIPQEWTYFSGHRKENLTFHTFEHNKRRTAVLEVRGAVFFATAHVGSKTKTVYLDLKIRELGSLGREIGGLLGVDSHEEEARPAVGCEGNHNVQLHREFGDESHAEEAAEDAATGLLSTAWVE